MGSPPDLGQYLRLRQGVVTDKEWEVLEPLLPKPRNLGDLRKYLLREILNGVLCTEERMFLEDDAEGSSALEDGLPLGQEGRRGR